MPIEKSDQFERKFNSSTRTNENYHSCLLLSALSLFIPHYAINRYDIYSSNDDLRYPSFRSDL